MKPLGISHDNAHCNGTYGCKMRDRCVRYLLHLEAKELMMEYVTYMQPRISNLGCLDFWIKEDTI